MKYLLLLLFVSGSLKAHELTPTYPELQSSYMKDIMQVNLKMWNARVDVEYYKIEVTDEDWNDVHFITREKTFKLEHFGRRDIEIFLPSDTTATYICTKSLLQKGNAQRSIVSSKVCSKIK
tara:strand:- start:285 stop:647 length:363 start_codon:yes stop_codon:yes gene_type:complete